MKKTVIMEEDELIAAGVGILMEHLGPVETARFLAMIPARRAESVKRHRAWQAKLDPRKFFDEVFTGKTT